MVSIIIPNKDHVDDLDRCLKSIYEKSTYQNFEVLVVEGSSEKQETFAYYTQAEYSRKNLRVLYWKKDFNPAAMYNFAAAQAKGEYLLFLDNDVEVITPDWMEEMLGYCQQETIGIVGAKLYYPNDMRELFLEWERIMQLIMYSREQTERFLPVEEEQILFRMSVL